MRPSRRFPGAAPPLLQLAVFQALLPCLLLFSVTLSTLPPCAAGPPKMERYMQLLERLRLYRPELPPALLSRAVGLQGDRSRLERVLDLLIQGQAVSVALLGGSLSLRGWNHVDESYIAQVHKWMELTFVEGCRQEVLSAAPGQSTETAGSAADAGDEGDEGAGRRRDGRDKDPRRSMRQYMHDADPRLDPSTDLHAVSSPQYLDTQHICSASNIHLLNLAVPAAGPGYAERCAMQQLPPDVDLVLLDFGCNDYVDSRELYHPERKAYERILRHTLSRSKQPAVLDLEGYSWAQSAGAFHGSLAQDKHMLMVEYYGTVQVLSIRAALYQLMQGSSDPRRLIHLGTDDQLHLSLLGHRWYADVIISYLTEAAVALLARRMAAHILQQHTGTGTGAAAAGGGHAAGPGFQPSPQLLAALDPQHPRPQGPGPGAQGVMGRAARARSSPPALSSQSPAAEVDSSSGSWVEGGRGVAYPTHCAQAPAGSSGLLCPPFFPGNELQALGVCAVGEELRQVVMEPLGDWQLQDDPARNSSGAGGHKWGYVSSKVGAELVLRVPLSPDPKAPAAAAPGDISAWLIYLKSHADMGKASLQCSNGCSCAAVELDAHMHNKASVPVLTNLELHPEAGSSTECHVKVTILPSSSSGGHRFKVLGLTTSHTDIWHIDAVFRGLGPSP